MSGMPWFRVYSDILTDRKIQRICKITGQSKALIIGVWISLLALANDSPNRGSLLIADDMPYTIGDLEAETGLPSEILLQLIDEFRAHGMITGKLTIEICNWQKRQFKSDSSAERVRRFREKRYSNVVDTDTESDTDTDQKENVTGSIFKHYENNIGDITKTISERLGNLIDEYPADWIIEAIDISAENNKRNLAYFSAILKRWKNEGKDNGKGKNKQKVNEEVERSKRATVDYY